MSYSTEQKESKDSDWAVPPLYEQYPDEYSFDQDESDNDDNDRGLPSYEQSLPKDVTYPPAPPSPGYIPDQMATGDMSAEAKKVRKALDRLITDKDDLIKVLSRCDPLQINLLRHTYREKFDRNLEKDIYEVSGHVGEALLALARGPLRQDVFNAHRVFEKRNLPLLCDTLVRRSNADIIGIKNTYFDVYKRDMVQDMKNCFGGMGYDRAELFNMILAAKRTEESVPVDPKLVERDVEKLWHSTNRPRGKNVRTIFEILTRRSEGHLRAIMQEYDRKHPGKPLKKELKWKFSSKAAGDDELPRDTLWLILRGAIDPAMTDAKLLEKSMKGFGTQDTLLINRLVRIHWDKDHLDQVKKAYKYKFKKDLKDRIEEETSGQYEDLMKKLLKYSDL